MPKNSRGDCGLDDLKPVESPSIVVAAAKALRDEVLRRFDKDPYLGSEDELVQRLGVSRPTFRQAARLLEYEELLTVRRGVGGGFFARKPSADAVARIAGIYLLAQGATFEEVIRAQTVLQSETLAQLADHPDREVRAKLLALVDGNAQFREPTDVTSVVRAINDYWRLASELAGNRALGLFFRTAQSFGARSSRFTLTLARASTYVEGLRRTAEAIAAGDAELAIAINRGQGRTSLEWAADDSRRS
jgi:DNA-binding FadR family transcriptional regulator